MYCLSNILEFIVDGLDDRPLSKHDLVIDGHQFVLHVALKPCNQMYPVGEETREEGLGDISFVCIYPSQNIVCQPVEYIFIPVVHICPGQHEVDQFTFFRYKSGAA